MWSVSNSFRIRQDFVGSDGAVTLTQWIPAFAGVTVWAPTRIVTHPPTSSATFQTWYCLPSSQAQEHSGLAVGHLPQPAAVLTGHPDGLPALLGEVAAVQHPHRLRMTQPRQQGSARMLDAGQRRPGVGPPPVGYGRTSLESTQGRERIEHSERPTLMWSTCSVANPLPRGPSLPLRGSRTVYRRSGVSQGFRMNISGTSVRDGLLGD